MSGKDDHKEAILRRLHRVEGQIRGIIRMVEQGEGCDEVLNQVAAARSAIDRVGVHIITQRMKECLTSRKAKSADDAIGEAVNTFLRFSSMR